MVEDSKEWADDKTDEKWGKLADDGQGVPDVFYKPVDDTIKMFFRDENMRSFSNPVETEIFVK